jgi:hypothetical protein
MMTPPKPSYIFASRRLAREHRNQTRLKLRLNSIIYVPCAWKIQTSSPGFPVEGRPFQCTTKIWTGTQRHAGSPASPVHNSPFIGGVLTPKTRPVVRVISLERHFFNYLLKRMVGHVFIDGNDVASAIIRPGAYNPVLRSGAKTKDGLRPFTFAKLNLTGTSTLSCLKPSWCLPETI